MDIGPGAPLIQIPPSPRTAAAPPDTSVVRAVPGQYPPKVPPINPLTGKPEMFTPEQIEALKRGQPAIPHYAHGGIARIPQIASIAERGAEANKFSDGWLKQHPDDSKFLFYLGDVAIGTNDLPQAEARYVV